MDDDKPPKPHKPRKRDLVKQIEAVSLPVKKAFLLIDWWLAKMGVPVGNAVVNDRSTATKVDVRFGLNRHGYLLSWGFTAARNSLFKPHPYATLSLSYRVDDPDQERRDDALTLEYHARTELKEGGWIFDAFYEDELPAKIEKMLTEMPEFRPVPDLVKKWIARFGRRFVNHVHSCDALLASKLDPAPPADPPANDNGQPSVPPVAPSQSVS